MFSVVASLPNWRVAVGDCSRCPHTTHYVKRTTLRQQSDLAAPRGRRARGRLHVAGGRREAEAKIAVAAGMSSASCGEGMSGKEDGVACVRARETAAPESARLRRALRTATRTSGGRLALRRRGLRGNKLTSPATHNEHCYGSTNTQESHYLGLMSIIIYSKSCTHTVFTSSHTSPTLLLI